MEDKAVPELSNVTDEDVKAFVSSLCRRETPWALGCAAVMTSIWGDRKVLKEACREAASALATLTQNGLDAARYKLLHNGDVPGVVVTKFYDSASEEAARITYGVDGDALDRLVDAGIATMQVDGNSARNLNSECRRMSDTNTFSADHPHGPPDPQWIAPNGSCALCARSWAEAAESKVDALMREKEELRTVREMLPWWRDRFDDLVSDAKVLLATLASIEGSESLRPGLGGIKAVAEQQRDSLSEHIRALVREQQNKMEPQ